MGNKNATRDQAMLLTDEAFMLLENGNYSEAKLKLEEALSLANDIAETHHEYSVLLLFEGEIEKAKYHSLKSVELQPNRPIHWMGLSKIYYELGHYPQALQLVLTSEQLDPNYPSINLAKMEIAKAMNASLIKIWRLRRRAKKYYKKIGKRSDGMPLSKDDIDKLFQN